MSFSFQTTSCLLSLLLLLGLWDVKKETDVLSSWQPKPGRIKIDQKTPSVFLKYEKTLPQGNGSNGKSIILSLNNNTKWKIVYRLIPGEEKQGIFPVFYYVQDAEGYPAFKKAIGDVVISVNLEPGGAIKFSVPIEHLASKNCVFVDYSYEWEKVNNITAINEPKHSVSFCGVKLPPLPN